MNGLADLPPKILGDELTQIDSHQPLNDRKAAGSPAFVLHVLAQHHWYCSEWHVSRGPSPSRGLGGAGGEGTSFAISRHKFEFEAAIFCVAPAMGLSLAGFSSS